ncbi:helix-turn-helix transcriptional regulator [Aliarcobacter butzleri]|uniref:helix-turn-helix transcriptional regulator n=1 Tax=Aliarcobacter butzleri TaxID=28197 RepID=UPI0021B45BA5|nr:AlpA family phage regulatory protein [Aliarcobacter butzleri]MCT7586619.1 AlpA family phage regulatory protein [Aliarcobacter butzleri]
METLLRRPEVEKLIGIKCSTIYHKIKNLRFPPQHRYGGTACWRMSEVQLYIDIGEEEYHKMLVKQKELEKVS